MNDRKIVGLASLFTARTEQYQVTGGSIDTSVQRRNPGGKKLDLRMGNGAKLAGEIPHPCLWQILNTNKREPGAHLIRHQGQRALDISAHHIGVDTGFRSTRVFLRDGWDPAGARCCACLLYTSDAADE